MPGEVRNDGPTLSLFEGGIRLSLHEDSVVVTFTIKGESDGGVERAAVANFALDLSNLVFLARSLMSYADLARPLLVVPAAAAESLLPLHDDGTCPECDSASPINAEGDVRRCGNCRHVWRVK